MWKILFGGERTVITLFFLHLFLCNKTAAKESIWKFKLYLDFWAQGRLLF